MKKGERRRVQGKRSMRESLSLILNKVAEVIYVFGHNLLFLNPNWTIGDAFPNSICKSHVTSPELITNKNTYRSHHLM